MSNKIPRDFDEFFGRDFDELLYFKIVFITFSGGPQGCNGPTTVVTTVALPQAPTPVPLRHALPQSPVGVRPAPQLPRSPVRQHQLPTTPLQRSLVQHQQGSRLSPQLRTNGQQCIMVNPARTSHLSMLPQNPTPGLFLHLIDFKGVSDLETCMDYFALLRKKL